MPIYEYRCTACGAETELFHGISEKPSLKCPACGKVKLQKVVSAAGFRLAGGGWYETDFKSDKKKNLAGDAAEKKPETADKKPAEAKPDKPAKAEKGEKADKKKPDKPAAKAAG